MEEIYQRTELLLGRQAVEKLKNAHVAVFGVGGVGGFAVEALARAGVGAIDLIDSDVVSLSNINRQIIATTDTVGQYKTEAFKRRISTINPNCTVTAFNMFFLPETAHEIDFGVYDYIIDAIDTVAGKLAIAEKAQQAGVPEISAMGAGNKLDPTAFEVADIYKTSICPLARVMRTECRRRGIKKLKVVYSKEPPASQDDIAAKEIADANTKRRSTPGSVSFVPSVMGLIIAGEVIKDLTGYNKNRI